MQEDFLCVVFYSCNFLLWPPGGGRSVTVKEQQNTFTAAFAISTTPNFMSEAPVMQLQNKERHSCGEERSSWEVRHGKLLFLAVG